MSMPEAGWVVVAELVAMILDDVVLFLANHDDNAEGKIFIAADVVFVVAGSAVVADGEEVHLLVVVVLVVLVGDISLMLT